MNHYRYETRYSNPKLIVNVVGAQCIAPLRLYIYESNGIAIVKSTNLIETSQIGLNETVTKMLRLLRHRQPMNWDPWILKDGDIYRLYYPRGLEGQNPWWTVSKLCGTISTDLQHWQDLGTLLAPEPANYWESGRISAGCTYKENDTYYLFYSAGGNEGIHLKNKVIGLATSRDGVHFSRQNYF